MNWREINSLPSHPATFAIFPTVLMLWTFVVPVLPGPAWMQFSAMLGGVIGMLGIPLIVFSYPSIGIICFGLACIPGDPAKRKTRLRWGLTMFLGVAAMAILLYPALRLRRWAISAAASRAEPLIQALEEYRTIHGNYPPTLSQLLPDQLGRVPGTGMMGDPDWTYRLSSGDEAWQGLNGGKAPAYDLLASCTLPMKFDSLHYWPAGDYPQEMYGRVVERIGKWAYVHE